MRTLVWFRGKDLRTIDHAPLCDAVAHGEVIAVFVLDPYFFAPDRAQQLCHRMQFLLDALRELSSTLAQLGSQLIVLSGKSVQVIPEAARQFRADRVVAYRWTEPFARLRDNKIAAAMAVPLHLYEGETLLPPGTLRTQQGRPFAVYTQFAKTFAKTFQLTSPLPEPTTLPPIPRDVTNGCNRLPIATIPTLADLGIVHNPHIQTGGQTAAQQRLMLFLAEALSGYADRRNRLDHAGTSRLSADLKFGTLSVRALWHAVTQTLPRGHVDRQAYLNELVWREFAYSTLWDRPQVLTEPFRRDFADFPWRVDDGNWQAWACGRTGYPVVDAAARQLLGEGFVHNRARMISASFLTKHLMVSYKQGESHYLQYLTDGDWAVNNAAWQWCAGCGCDAQPYFRVFNPVTQGQRFDPNGDYVRRWVPELARVPENYIHQVWTAPAEVLRASDVQLGHTYPKPIVDHQVARQRFLQTAAAHLRPKG